MSLDVALSYTRYAVKTRVELIDEIARLERELKSKSSELELAKKRLAIYKSVKT